MCVPVRRSTTTTTTTTTNERTNTHTSIAALCLRKSNERDVHVMFVRFLLFHHWLTRSHFSLLVFVVHSKGKRATRSYLFICFFSVQIHFAWYIHSRTFRFIFKQLKQQQHQQLIKHASWCFWYIEESKQRSQCSQATIVRFLSLLTRWTTRYQEEKSLVIRWRYLQRNRCTMEESQVRKKQQHCLTDVYLSDLLAMMWKNAMTKKRLLKSKNMSKN